MFPARRFHLKQNQQPDAVRTGFHERLTETIEISCQIDKTLPSGVPVFFGLTLKFEPLNETFSGHDVSLTLASFNLPPEMQFVLTESLQHCLNGGCQFGYPLLPLRISITTVDFCSEKSTEIAVRWAAVEAFRMFVNQGAFTTTPN